MRERFDEQLSHLHREMIEMGAQCEEVIALAIDALIHHDVTLVEKVFALEKEIDKKEREIESICLRLLLQQQPIASDLREISAALKMISDMERIGDQALDIAELAQHTDLSEVREKLPLGKMSRAVMHMVNESVSSYVRKDLNMARSVMAYDDIVDAFFNETKEKIIHLLSVDPHNHSEACIDLLMAAKYLERIGDHAENIAEWVEFSISGTRPGE